MKITPSIQKEMVRAALKVKEKSAANKKKADQPDEDVFEDAENTASKNRLTPHLGNHVDTYA